MAEIKREPIKIMIDDKSMDAFDEAHTIGDVLRMLIKENGKDECERVLASLPDRAE